MKFNFSLRGKQSDSLRYAFVKAGIPDAQEDLYRNILIASLGDHPSQPLSAEVRSEILAADPEWIARLATHLDAEKNFHAAALWLTAELAAAYGKDERIGLLLEGVIKNPADIPDWLGYFQRAAGPAVKPDRVIRKVLDRVFNWLDEFSFSRYSQEMQTRIREALLALQPKAEDRNKRNLFGKIAKDLIPVRTTWEQEWHALHHQHYDSPERRQVVLRDKWKEGISSFRIGYTALLDNLRPMLCAGVSGKVLKLAAEYLGNVAAVRRSGVSPLRLLEVHQALGKMDQGGAGMLAEALEAAVASTGWNTLGNDGSSLIAMDVSNSMKHSIYPGGIAQRFDIAPLLAGLWKSNGYPVITGIIGNTWKPVEWNTHTILAATQQFRERDGEAGYGINAHLILQDLIRRTQAVDRVLIFTDYSLWGSRGFNQPAGSNIGDWWRQYRREIAPQAKLYLFDLAGYGAKPLECPGDDVFLIAGWKEGILDTLAAIEDRKPSEVIQ